MCRAVKDPLGLARVLVTNTSVILYADCQLENCGNAAAAEWPAQGRYSPGISLGHSVGAGWRPHQVGAARPARRLLAPGPGTSVSGQRPSPTSPVIDKPRCELPQPRETNDRDARARRDQRVNSSSTTP